MCGTSLSSIQSVLLDAVSWRNTEEAGGKHPVAYGMFVQSLADALAEQFSTCGILLSGATRFDPLSSDGFG